MIKKQNTQNIVIETNEFTGWLAACVFSILGRDLDINVKVIEKNSTQIPAPVSLTPELRAIHSSIGLNEEAFLKVSGSKRWFGTHFHDSSEDGYHNIQSFDEYGSAIEKKPFIESFQELELGFPYSSFSIGASLCKKEHVSHEFVGAKYKKNFNYGFISSSEKLYQFYKKVALKIDKDLLDKKMQHDEKTLCIKSTADPYKQNNIDHTNITKSGLYVYKEGQTIFSVTKHNGFQLRQGFSPLIPDNKKMWQEDNTLNLNCFKHQSWSILNQYSISLSAINNLLRFMGTSGLNPALMTRFNSTIQKQFDYINIIGDILTLWSEGTKTEISPSNVHLFEIHNTHEQSLFIANLLINLNVAKETIKRSNEGAITKANTLAQIINHATQ